MERLVLEPNWYNHGAWVRESYREDKPKAEKLFDVSWCNE